MSEVTDFIQNPPDHYNAASDLPGQGLVTPKTIDEKLRSLPAGVWRYRCCPIPKNFCDALKPERKEFCDDKLFKALQKHQAAYDKIYEASRPFWPGVFRRSFEKTQKEFRQAVRAGKEVAGINPITRTPELDQQQQRKWQIFKSEMSVISRSCIPEAKQLIERYISFIEGRLEQCEVEFQRFLDSWGVPSSESGYWNPSLPQAWVFSHLEDIRSKLSRLENESFQTGYPSPQSVCLDLVDLKK